jgi:predicted SpoU family rRNA methylase
MSKKYKLVVSDTVVVPVSGNLKDANGRAVSFKFSLTCRRIGADELKEKLESQTTIKDILREVTTGWTGQRLVLEEDDTPAEFCDDAFDSLINIAGLAMVCFNCFVKENGAAEKN